MTQVSEWFPERDFHVSVRLRGARTEARTVY